MKKFYLLSVLFFGLFNGFSQTPITLTFQAKDSLNQSPLTLDSVYVQNLTENCDTTLYDAVSVLNYIALWPVGIKDPDSRGSESFTVMQNAPNPFRGSTLVRIHLQNAGDLNLAVYDNQGKQLSEYHNGFEKGWHLFGISTNGANLLFLKVSDNTSSKTIRLISAGSGNEGNRISYQGQDGRGVETLKSASDRTGFIVYLGNQLQYTAYVDGYQESVLSDNPETSKTYTFAMLHPGFICGSSFTINHVAGVVAPVNKTVTYGTVTNIPGETSKCWITSNLGADHQATAKNDATEPSAGWYWQFNRKQGYKHTGSARTPNTTWITSIEEDFDWQAANDPCALELGAGWRIPTSLEWTNVDASGNWTNWNGPWNSALKMHAAGVLGNGEGYLYSRGSEGYYWSGTQSSYGGGIVLPFNSSSSAVYNGEGKATGASIRCIRYGNASAVPTVTTTAMTDIARTSATSGGIVTNDGGAFVTARGVCWSTLPNPTIDDNHTSDGTGTGSFVSHLANLAPNTPYYVRAYASTSFGTGYGNEVPFTTLSFDYTCDASVTINHVAGAVAPVNKTVTYGIAGNVPGEISKCWITSNLGADHQATAVNDATEPSAGWYWQFNRKQGYKHTGSVRTPNTTWITSINENFNWQPANDPCALELGTGWHIPTKSEWENAYTSGNWANGNGPWNSVLKLHASGYLLYANGTLSNRGSYGGYWSSTQSQATEGWVFYLWANVGSGIGFDTKSGGNSIRCLREAGTSTLPTVTTSGITDIAQSTATGGGEVTADGGAEVTARGACWSTLPNPTTADSLTSDGTGTGVFVSNLTGLTPNTPYYVRAYATNSVGTAYGDEVTFTTLPAAFTCGTSLIIHHVAGAVAPVNKTVTYGTVTNIPGETSKCWITSNLGADHQATAKNDATEASAGWYWQFNRKQGYKHTGSLRTPNTTWISSINENSDWIPANDPCALELGAGWRIPSGTEWTNVHASGNWTNWNGPWNSALKLHAAGYIAYQDGSLQEHGISGSYWSHSQTPTENTRGNAVLFTSAWCYVFDEYKAGGFTLRCIK